MGRRILCLLWTVALAAAVSGCATGASNEGAQAPRPQRLPILQLHRGDAPSLKYPQVQLIDSESNLQRVDAPTLDKLGVDLEHRDMILLAMGREPTGGYWANITSVTRLGRTLTIHGRMNQPAPGAATTQQVTYPYCVVVIPKTGALRVDNRVESVVGQSEPPAMP